MSEPQVPTTQPPTSTGLGDPRKQWIWYLVLGTAIILAGLWAVGYSVVATLTSVVLFGVALVVAGVAHMISAFIDRKRDGFFIHALAGLLYILLGVFLVEAPLRAAAVLTLVLAISFLVGGAARLLFAATHKFPGRGWVAFNGAITFILGAMIWQGLPEASLWVIGLFVGIELVFSGCSWVLLGLAAKADLMAETASTANNK